MPSPDGHGTDLAPAPVGGRGVGSRPDDPDPVPMTYEWRGWFDNGEINALHAEGFGHRILDDDWRGQVERHSLGWVCARDGTDLVGFVNVASDGAVHAFVLDTLVASHARRQGIGTGLVKRAVDGARDAGCEWIHVDFDGELASFYFEACGFAPTPAGVIALGAARGVSGATPDAAASPPPRRG
jgi:GNAT superfamily N-acetyltransferase